MRNQIPSPTAKSLPHDTDFHVEKMAALSRRGHTQLCEDKIELIFVSAAVLRPRGNDFRKNFGLRKRNQSEIRNGLNLGLEALQTVLSSLRGL